MALIKWRPEYSVDIPKLDEQHRRLLELLNELLAAFQKGSVDDTVRRICDNLSHYATEHFTDEETYLSQIGHPELSKQKIAHTFFLSQLEQLTEKVETESISFREMNHFLRHWFKDHILTEDMKYKPSTADT